MNQMKQAFQQAGIAVPPAPRSTTMDAADIDLTKYLSNGGRCVVLGGRTTNFTEAMRRHAQFVFWDSIDPKASGRDLPTNARVLLCTRFSDHQWENYIRRQARDRGVFCPPGLLSTGDIRDVIQRFLDSPAAKVAVPTNAEVEPPTHVVHVEPAPKVAADAFTPVANVTVAAPEQTEPTTTTEEEGTNVVAQKNRSWLYNFVAQHADLDASPQINEARRVAALLTKLTGRKSTNDSVANTMYQLRMAAGKPRMRQGGDHRIIHNAGMPRPAAQTLAPAVLAEADTRLKDIARTPPPAATKRQPSFDSDLTAAMEMAEDAMKRVDDAREAMSLAIDALKKLQSEDKVRRERLARIRAALGEGE